VTLRALIADALVERDALVPRCSTAVAAKYIGCTARHVEKLIRAGVLESWDVRAPGAQRARHSVVVASVKALLAERYRNSEHKLADPSLADSHGR
jgi:hypothetical protein